MDARFEQSDATLLSEMLPPSMSVENQAQIAASMYDPDDANLTGLSVKAINAKVFKVWNRPTAQSTLLRALERLQSAEILLGSDLPYCRFYRGRKTCRGIDGLLVKAT